MNYQMKQFMFKTFFVNVSIKLHVLFIHILEAQCGDQAETSSPTSPKGPTQGGSWVMHPGIRLPPLWFWVCHLRTVAAKSLQLGNSCVERLPLVASACHSYESELCPLVVIADHSYRSDGRLDFYIYRFFIDFREGG